MFRSFFQAGFECATGQNADRRWIDQIAATEHDLRVREDYRLLREVGIATVREGVRWPLVDRGLRYDFSSLDPMLAAAEELGVQLVYDLFHYGYPASVDPFSNEFVDRFSDYCYETARYLRARTDPPHFFTPVNEPSYLAWAAGDACRFAPHACGRSFELKVQLIRAAIAGIDAIRGVLPGARMVNADPLCRVAVPRGRPDLAEEVHAFNEEVVFQSWDMLAGRLYPELGGSPEHLDIVGLNYYWTNQWEHGSPDVPLSEDDERSWPIRDLVRWVWHRYKREMAITETAHVGQERGLYLERLADEIEAVLREGLPLRGVCYYPVLGMPEWHDRAVYTHMGLWDLEPTSDGLRRAPYEPGLRALAAAQRRLRSLVGAPAAPIGRGRGAYASE